MTLNDSMIGCPIYTQDGRQIGTVKEIRGRFFKVDAPMRFDYWLRDDCVASANDGQMALSVTEDRLDPYKVTEPTYSDTKMPSSTVSTTERPETTTTTQDEQNLRLHEERLQAHTTPVQAGEVTVGKDVVTEHQEMDVPVRREEVHIERHPVEGRPTTGEIREGEEIHIPVHEEQVHVEKETHPYEEVQVTKSQVQDTEHVAGEVRREEATIDRHGEVPVHGTTTPGVGGWNDISSDYRQRWQTRYAATGGRFEDYEPYYRYGYEMSTDPRYRNRTWSDVEPELRTGYRDWAQQHGYGGDANGWERFKDAVRESWDNARGEQRAA